MAILRPEQRPKGSVIERLQVGETYIQPLFCREHHCQVITVPNPIHLGAYVHICTGKKQTPFDLMKSGAEKKPPQAHMLVESPNMLPIIIAQDEQNMHKRHFLYFREKNADGKYPNNQVYLPFLQFTSIKMTSRQWTEFVQMLEAMFTGVNEEDFDEPDTR